MASFLFRIPELSQQEVIDNVRIRLLPADDESLRSIFRELIEKVGRVRGYWGD